MRINKDTGAPVREDLCPDCQDKIITSPDSLCEECRRKYFIAYNGHQETKDRNCANCWCSKKMICVFYKIMKSMKPNNMIMFMYKKTVCPLHQFAEEKEEG